MHWLRSNSDVWSLTSKEATTYCNHKIPKIKEKKMKWEPKPNRPFSNQF